MNSLTEPSSTLASITFELIGHVLELNRYRSLHSVPVSPITWQSLFYNQLLQTSCNFYFLRLGIHGKRCHLEVFLNQSLIIITQRYLPCAFLMQHFSQIRVIIKQGRITSRGVGRYRILEKGVRNTDRRSPVVGLGTSSTAKYLTLRSSDIAFPSF